MANSICGTSTQELASNSSRLKAIGLGASLCRRMVAMQSPVIAVSPRGGILPAANACGSPTLVVNRCTRWHSHRVVRSPSLRRVIASRCTISSLGDEYLELSADGKRLVSVGWNAVRLWDFGAGRYRNLEYADDSMPNVTITADGSRVAVASWERDAQVWSFDSGAQLAAFSGRQFDPALYKPRQPHKVYEVPANVRSVELTHDGRGLLWVWQEPRGDSTNHSILSDVGTRKLIREYTARGQSSGFG